MKKTLVALFKSEKASFSSLDYIFCHDSYLLKINQDFLKHDDFTDIITFNLSVDIKVIIGEIYISIDRLKENSRMYKTSFQDELSRVIFHGALHLCGYKDKRKDHQLLMRTKEDEYIRRFKKHIKVVPRGTR